LTNPIFLSIIIPAYNEEKRLPTTLEQVAAYLEKQSFSAEVLVIENGSFDRTLEIAQDFASKHPQFKAFHKTGRGKGLAVRHGMLKAQGTFRFMCDADLSMPIDELNRFLPPAVVDADIVIGSREAPGAVRYKEPAYRHIGGRAINSLIRWFALPNLQDTQCGFKCFRGEVAEDLFKHQRINGWSFDIELLYVARMRGYKIIELPIPWYYSPDSHVQPVKDAIRLTLDVLDIRRNARQGVYDKKV